MKKIIFLSFAAITVACYIGSLNASDKLFNRIKVKFKHETKVDASKIPIVFGKLENDEAAAICHYYEKSKQNNYIVVARNYWNEMSDKQQINLIYHEIGHCVLLRENHNDRRDKKGCPISIMNSHVFSETDIDKCFIPFYSRYIRELKRK